MNDNTKKNAIPNWKRLKQGDLDWSVFSARMRVLQAVREFFVQRNFLEIEAPLMTPYPTLDANILSVPARYDDGLGRQGTLFLHSSPEHAMKKLLAAGAERIVSIGKVFRDAEQTRLHNGEFTMVEWYRSNSDYHEIMADTEALIRHVASALGRQTFLTFQERLIDLSSPWRRRTVRDLFLCHVGIDLEQAWEVEALRSAAKAHGIHTEEDDDWETLYFRLFLEKIEPYLGLGAPEFVVDYPSCMGLMAKKKKDAPLWVERAELYMGGLELSNGYSELVDPDEQLERFKADQAIKKRQTGIAYPIDNELIEALREGVPPSAGMALGLDRLIMLLLDKSHITDVLLFPIHQF